MSHVHTYIVSLHTQHIKQIYEKVAKKMVTINKTTIVQKTMMIMMMMMSIHTRKSKWCVVFVIFCMHLTLLANLAVTQRWWRFLWMLDLLSMSLSHLPSRLKPCVRCVTMLTNNKWQINQQIKRNNKNSIVHTQAKRWETVNKSNRANNGIW